LIKIELNLLIFEELHHHGISTFSDIQ